MKEPSDADAPEELPFDDTPEDMSTTAIMTFEQRLERDFEALEELTRKLPETDGVPLESPWHFAAIGLMIQLLTYHWRGRDDFFVGGNMFVYYSTRQLKNEDFRGPDFFYVNGVDRFKPRDFWAIWVEDARFPDLIIEYLSDSTAQTDRTTKKKLYEQTFRTSEYFCYDPDTNQLEGWRLGNGSIYAAITLNERGWMWSEQLQLWLGTWRGEYQGLTAVWLRCYDSEGRLVLLPAEAESQRAEAESQRAEAERQHAEAESQRAEAESQRAEAESQQAEAERQRAEAERQRAEALEIENARLRERLAQLEHGQGGSNNS
jgi:Uma2 family endonuclease